MRVWNCSERACFQFLRVIFQETFHEPLSLSEGKRGNASVVAHGFLVAYRQRE